MFPKWMPNPFGSMFPGAQPEPKFNYTPDPERLRAMQERQRASDYLVQLSRSSPRGQAYDRRQQELLAMLKRSRTTSDKHERHVIVNAMRNKGLLSE